MQRVGRAMLLFESIQCASLFLRHSGASRSDEPGIYNHDREYGFRACAKRRILRCAIAHPGMTIVMLKGRFANPYYSPLI
jgi:hypothetical protein